MSVFLLSKKKEKFYAIGGISNTEYTNEIIKKFNYLKNHTAVKMIDKSGYNPDKTEFQLRILAFSLPDLRTHRIKHKASNTVFGEDFVSQLYDFARKSNFEGYFKDKQSIHNKYKKLAKNKIHKNTFSKIEKYCGIKIKHILKKHFLMKMLLMQ